MAERKICPKKFADIKFNDNLFCEGENCAWWINSQYAHETGCAYFVIANALKGLVHQGEEEVR